MVGPEMNNHELVERVNRWLGLPITCGVCGYVRDSNQPCEQEGDHGVVAAADCNAVVSKLVERRWGFSSHWSDESAFFFKPNTFHVQFKLRRLGKDGFADPLECAGSAPDLESAIYAAADKVREKEESK